MAAGADPFGHGQDKDEFSELMTVPGNEDGTVARAAGELSPIEAPFYAIAPVGTVLNTQDGPKRSAGDHKNASCVQLCSRLDPAEEV